MKRKMAALLISLAFVLGVSGCSADGENGLER